MNPENLWWQALLAAFTGIGCAVVGGPGVQWAGAALSGATCVAVLGLNHGYWRSLAVADRSVNRAQKDRVAGRSTIPTLAGGMVGSVVVAATTSGIAGEAWGDRAAWVIAAVAFTIAAQILVVSSCIDWYYIKPRRDGVVTAPPCERTTEREMFRTLTRIWIWHRLVAAGMAILVVVGLSESVIVFVSSHEDSWVVGTLVALIPAAILAVVGNYRENWVLALTSSALNDTPVALGDRVRSKTRTGIAYDVSIPKGYRVIDESGVSWWLKFEEIDEDHTLSVDQSAPGPEWRAAVLLSNVVDADEFSQPRSKPRGSAPLVF